eukprot:TRINITY_DN7816_c0_g1_i6.p1 TRINITY_DN7816_c0_g1~~TRINITY_DN7816_c0_g1_i6.p1  ORF type:complete len:2459 (-),score=327.82 TRINITY_DN7816_c0_g1_i6:166-7542(-)
MTPFEVLAAIEAKAMPWSLSLICTVWHLIEICLLAAAAHPQLGIAGSANILTNSLRFQVNLSGFQSFIALWAILLSFVFSGNMAVLLCSRYCNRNSPTNRFLWTSLKVALLVVFVALYVPCLGAFVSPLFCHSNKLRAFEQSQGSVPSCWSSGSVTVFVFSVIGFVLLVSTNLILRLLIFCTSPLSTDPCARAHGRCEGFSILWLAAIVLYGVRTDNQVAFAICLAALCAVTSALYCIIQPYYHTATNRLHAAAYALASWFAVSSAARLQPQYLPLGAALFIGAWLAAGLRVRNLPVLQYEGAAQKWIPCYPYGLHLASLRRRSSVYNGPQCADVQETTSALLEGRNNDTDQNDPDSKCHGTTVARIYLASDVELATRFLATPAAREANRQGRPVVTASRWSRALCAVADQYFQRGLRKYPQSALVRLQYARFLTLWQQSHDAAHQILSDLHHDQGTPLDVRYFAYKELSELRGTLDLDNSSVVALRKAREEHVKALNALLAFLKEVKTRSGMSQATDYATLSHLGHVLSLKRSHAREIYREALANHRRLDRSTLQHWSLFLEHLMLDHSAAQRVNDYLERMEGQSLSQRSGLSGTATSTATSSTIPGLMGDTATGADSNSAEAQALGMARLLRRNIQIAFALLVCLVVAILVYHYVQTQQRDSGNDRIEDIATLRTLTYKATTLAAERQRRSFNSNSSSPILAGTATLPGKSNVSDGYAAMSDAELLEGIICAARDISSVNSRFIGQAYKADYPPMKTAHATPLLPLRLAPNNQVVIRMTSLWEFGQFVSGFLLGIPADPSVGKSVFDATTATSNLLRNAPHIGAAYNRSQWLYADNIVYYGRRELLGQVFLLFSSVFVLGATALLFLWSFTRIAQQRLVVLRFFTMLPQDVVSALQQQTEKHLDDLQHPTIEIGSEKNAADTDDEGRAGVDTDDERAQPPQEQSHHLPLSFSDTTPSPSSPQRQASPGAKGKTSEMSLQAVPRRSGSDLSEILLSASASDASIERPWPVNPPGAVPPPRKDSVVNGMQPRKSSLVNRATRPHKPEKPVIEPLSSKLVRIRSPQHSPQPAKPAHPKTTTANATTNRRIKALAAAKRAPYIVFMLSAVIFLLVTTAVVILIGVLVDLGRLEQQSINNAKSASALSSLWVTRVANTRFARKHTSFGQVRRYTEYWNQDYIMQSVIYELANSDLPSNVLETTYRAWYIDANNARSVEKISMGLTAMCFNLSVYTMPEIMYLRWAADPNDTATDAITLLKQQTHSDYYTDLASASYAKCKAAKSVLFTDAFKSKLSTVSSSLLTASNLGQTWLQTELQSSHDEDVVQQGALLGIFLTILVILIVLGMELRWRHRQLWAFRTVRILLAQSAVGAGLSTGTIIATFLVINTELAAITRRNEVAIFVSQLGKGVDTMNSLSFEFSAFPDLTIYKSYLKTYRDFNATAAAGLPLLTASTLPYYDAFRSAHFDYVELDFVALVVAGNAAGILGSMAELADYEWDGSSLPTAHFRNRSYDLSLPAGEQLQLALKILGDDLQTTRRSACTNTLAALQAAASQVTDSHVTESENVRRAIAWLILGVAAALGVASLALVLVLALRALDLSGSQAISRLNDPHLNSNIRTQRAALLSLAFIFVAMLATFAGLAQDYLSRIVPPLAWSLEHEALAAQCGMHANMAGIALNNQTFGHDQRRISDCVDRMNLVTRKLFGANDGESADSLLFEYQSGSGTGLYLMYTYLMQALQRLATAPTAFGPAATEAFASTRELLRRTMPLLQTAHKDSMAHADEAAQNERIAIFVFSGMAILILAAIYVTVFRPMLHHLMEDQATMRTLLALVPENALTTDMEEFLEKGIVQNSDLLLLDDRDDEEGPGGLWGDRIEEEADELKFLSAELEAMARSPSLTAVCSAEGVILWLNRVAQSSLAPDTVGQHLSFLLPSHAHVVFRQGAVPATGRHVALRTVHSELTEAALLRATAVSHPRTHQRYFTLYIDPLKDSAVGLLRQQVMQGTRPAEACPGTLEAHAAAVAVATTRTGIIYANSKMEKTLGKHLSSLLGQDFRTLIANSQLLPEYPTAPGTFLSGGYDALLLNAEGKTVPHFLHIHHVPGPQDEDLAVFCAYPIQQSQAVPPASAAASTPRSTGSGTNINSPQPARRLKQPRHSEMQLKRCSVLVLEFTPTEAPSNATASSSAIAAARSGKLLNAVFEAAAQHSGHLHWITGDQCTVTFNHSSANGSHVLSACGTAMAILTSGPSSPLAPDSHTTSPNLRVAIASSNAHCGYYGRLPVLQGDCLATAGLLLRAMKETPCRCAIDPQVWQAAQYSYHTRLVNKLTVMASGKVQPTMQPKVIAVYELASAKQQEMDEWMYQLAHSESPFENYDEGVRRLQRSQVASARAALSKHLTSTSGSDDSVARWLLSVVDQMATRVEAGGDESASQAGPPSELVALCTRTEWCGQIPFRLDWALDE